MIRTALIAASVLGLAGCAAQPALLKGTASGKPEAHMAGVSLEQMKNEIVLVCAQRGMEVETSSHAVTCGRREEGGRGILAQALVGNAYSQTPMTKVRFTLAETNGGVFVVADPWLEMTMGFGEIKRIPITNNAFRNDLQSGLDQAAEKAKKAATGSSALQDGTQQKSAAAPGS